MINSRNQFDEQIFAGTTQDNIAAKSMAHVIIILGEVEGDGIALPVLRSMVQPVVNV
jgi:hypothetical protein